MKSILLRIALGVLAIIGLFGIALRVAGGLSAANMEVDYSQGNPGTVQPAPTAVWDQVDLKCEDNNLFGIPFSQVMNVNTVIAAAKKRGYEVQETTFDWEHSTMFLYFKPLGNAQITLIADSEAHMNGFIISIVGELPVFVAAAKDFLTRIKSCNLPATDLSDADTDVRSATWTLKGHEVVELYMQGNDQHPKMMVGVMIRWHEAKDSRGKSHAGISVSRHG